MTGMISFMCWFEQIGKMGMNQRVPEPEPRMQDLLGRLCAGASAAVRRTCLVWVGAALLLVACGNGQRSPIAVPPQEISVRDLNVLFVIVDAAAARYFGVYGNRLGTSPNVDALAREGTVFERAYAQAPQTSRSTASFLTGKYPPPPRVTDWHVLLENKTIASILTEHGFRTAAFSENPFVVGKFGFDIGFEVFRERFPLQRFLEGPDSYQRPDSEATVEEVIRWMRERPEERFFAYVHLLPPHSPYDPPEPFAGRLDSEYAGTVHGSVNTLAKLAGFQQAITLRDLEHLRLEYQENLAFADHLVGRLVEGLEGRGLLERTIVIVASDHGEAFREHGMLLHGTALYEEQIHVPLVIRFPARFGTLPKRWPGVTELRQLVPTLLDALKISHPAEEQSLMPLLREPGRPSTDIARSSCKSFLKGPPLFAVVTDSHKLIVGPDRQKKTELYDLGVDPGETVNLAPLKPELVEELLMLLDTSSFESLPVRNVEISEEKRRQLEALGYLD